MCVGASRLRRAGAETEARPETRPRRRRPPWPNRNFVLLWTGQFVSQVGDRLAMVAFPWLVHRRRARTISTGIVLAIYTLPYVLFGMFAGVAIDRFNKRHLMLAAELARMVLVLLVPFAADWSIWSVFVISFAMASLATLFDPAEALADARHRPQRAAACARTRCSPPARP